MSKVYLLLRYFKGSFDVIDSVWSSMDKAKSRKDALEGIPGQVHTYEINVEEIG